MRSVLVVLAATFLAAPVTAQQAVTETRDPRQQQDPEFAKAYAKWTTEPRYGSPLVDHLPKVAGIPIAQGRPRLLHRAAEDAHLLRRRAEVLPRAREGGAGEGEDRDHRQVRRRTVSSSSSGFRPKTTSGTSRSNRANLAKIADPRGMSETQVNAAHQLDQAALPPHGWTAQRRSRAIGNADGACLSTRRRDVAADQPDPRERVRVDHAAGRSGRSRSQRRLVLSRSRHGGGSQRGHGAHRPDVAAAPACRTGANTSITTTIATSTCRRCRCARSPIGTSPRIRRSCTTCTSRCALLYTYSGGPPQNPNLDPHPVRRAPVLRELGDVADDEVGHAGRLHARVHGRLVAWLPRLRCVQPQRHDEDVRDAVGRRCRRQRRDCRGWPRRSRRWCGHSGDGGCWSRWTWRSRQVVVAVAAPQRTDTAATAGRAGGDAAGGAPGTAPAGRGSARRPDGSWRRSAARVVSRHSDSRQRSRRRSRGATTRTTCRRRVLSSLQLTSMFPNLVRRRTST